MDADHSMKNEVLNDLLHSTSRLCSQAYYQKYISCTPVEVIRNLDIHYSRELKLLLCFSCSRVLNPNTTVRHLKRQHRTAYSRLNRNTVHSIREDINSLQCSRVEDIIVRHNTYYFSGLPITFDNFKCRECDYVDVCRKVVREHFLSQHPRKPKSTNQKADHVLDRVPLQALEGFPNNRKIYFIPKLPEVRTRTPPALHEDANSELSTPVRVVPDVVRAAILDAHQKSMQERERKQPYNDGVTHNKKLLDSFLTNSNILGFLHGKDRTILVDLVRSPSSSALELGKDVDLELLESNMLTFMLEVHKYIPNLTRRFRQLLKTEDSSKSYKEMKDFIQLNKPEPHLKRYCRLATFIIRVHLIQANYKQEASDEMKNRYFEHAQQIRLSGETTGLIQQLLELGVDPVQDDTDQQYTPIFNGLVSRLFHSFLKDPIHLKVKENATFRNPVIYFYFSSILHQDTKEILDCPMVGKVASILIYDARLMFLAHYYHVEGQQTLDEREINEMYEQDVSKYLSNNSKNYFEELTQIRAFSLKLAKQYKSTTYTIKESPAGTIEFNGIPYPIEQIRTFFARLGSQLETHLKGKLLFVDHLDSLGIQFNRIEDTPLLNKTGNSVADTPQLEKFKSWFLNELLTTGSAYNRFFVKDTENGRIRFKPSKVQRFIADLNVFAELLANAINLYSGGPLRGTELNLILYKNTSIKDRSMMYNKDAEMFFITTDYNKTQNITRRERNSYRYIVPMLSRIIIVYVAAVLPLRDYIYRHHYRDESFDNPYLLARNQGSVRSYSISIRLQKETAGQFRKGLSLQAWRKIINFIIKTKMHATPLQSDSSNDDSDSHDLVEDKQANRSTQVSFNHYFNAEHLKNSNVTPRELEALREFSIRYFNYFNLLDDFVRTERAHGTICVASHIEQPEMVTIDNRGLLQRLRRLYDNPKATFLNNEQRNCVSQVLANRPYITYINRTGSGKSLVYLLPASIQQDHLYIIVTPRLALKEDLYRRACDLKLRPSRFEDPVTYHSNLMFCSAEDLDSQELKKLVEKHRTFSREVTVMLDEAHLFLIEATFRLKLRDLTTILQYKANVVFITATLPRALLHLLNTTFGISRFNSIIRGSSNRSDISYRRVYFRTKEDRDETLCNTIREINQEDDDVGNKILIFVTNKRQGEKLATLLDTQVVYSGKEDLQPILEEFIKSKSQRTLVTTSILEVGIDIRQIRYTISIEPIHSLTSVVQSSGRIRRRGVSYVICQQPSKYRVKEIQRNSRVQREVRDIQDFSEVDKGWYELLTIEETCLRMPISQFLDQVPYRCQGHKDDLCSVCRDNDKVKEETRWAEETGMRERRGQWLELEEKLVSMKETYCMYCILDECNISNNINHSLLECKRMGEDEYMSQVRRGVRDELRRQKLPQHECGCFRCLMPKNICTKQQEGNGLAEEECFMGTFLPDMIGVLYRFQERAGEMVSGMGTGARGLGGFVSWVMAPWGMFTLKTVRLVERLGQVDVVKLMEELEESSSESSSDGGSEVGKEDGEVDGEEDVDLGMAFPEGMSSPDPSWRADAERAGWGVRSKGREKRRASRRLSEVFAAERERLRQRAEDYKGGEA